MRPANIPKMTAEIESLKTKARQSEARLKDALARENAARKKKARAAETRRKVIAGALVLGAFTRTEKPWPINHLIDLLDSELTRKDDRALFSDLIPLEKDNQK